MAITKERLQELIEQEATVYDNNAGVIPLVTNDKYITKLYDSCLYFAEKFYNVSHSSEWWEDYTVGFDELYENKEDAEFVAKNHTKRLSYFQPLSWSEVCDGGTYELIVPTPTYRELYILHIDKDEIYIQDIMHKYLHHSMYVEVLFLDKYKTNKKNYYKAVEKARKLFLGCNDEN